MPALLTDMSCWAQLLHEVKHRRGQAARSDAEALGWSTHRRGAASLSQHQSIDVAVPAAGTTPHLHQPECQHCRRGQPHAGCRHVVAGVRQAIADPVAADPCGVSFPHPAGDDSSGASLPSPPCIDKPSALQQPGCCDAAPGASGATGHGAKFVRARGSTPPQC